MLWVKVCLLHQVGSIQKYECNAFVQNIYIAVILSGYKEIFYDRILQFKTIIVDKWRRHRRMITPAFNAKLLEQFFPMFNEKNDILIRNVMKEINKTQVFDLWDYIAPFSLDSICRKYITSQSLIFEIIV